MIHYITPTGDGPRPDRALVGAALQTSGLQSMPASFVSVSVKPILFLVSVASNPKATLKENLLGSAGDHEDVAP